MLGSYQFDEPENHHDLCGKRGNLNKDMLLAPVVKKVEMVETLKTKLNLHHEIGTLLQSKQVLFLKGKCQFIIIRIVGPIVNQGIIITYHLRIHITFTV